MFRSHHPCDVIPALPCLSHIRPHHPQVVVVLGQQPTKVSKHLHLLELVPVNREPMFQGAPGVRRSPSLLAPQSPLDTKCRPLVPVVRHLGVRLHPAPPTPREYSLIPRVDEIQGVPYGIVSSQIPHHDSLTRTSGYRVQDNERRLPRPSLHDM